MSRFLRLLWTIGNRRMANNRDLAVKRRTAMLIRWLHIYLSMLSFAIVFFFAVTGLTLNHADKFGDQLTSTRDQGRLDKSWMNVQQTVKIADLHIIEYKRAIQHTHAVLNDFHFDEDQIAVSFKGPGFEADSFISRPSGKY